MKRNRSRECILIKNFKTINTMIKRILFINLVAICLFLPPMTMTAYGAITITNPGDGSGTIRWRAAPGGPVLESCNLGPAPSACNVGVSQDTQNGNILQAEALSNSYFSGWSGLAGSVGACSNSTLTCDIISAAVGAVNASFNACTFTVDPQNASFSWSGGAGNIAVTAAASNCSWTATESLDWVSITSGSSGTGNGTVSYSVSANRTTSSRTGILIVAGANVTIDQGAYPGKIRVEPDPLNFGTVRTGVTSELGVEISNVGISLLNITSMEINGTNKDEFGRLGSCSSISAGNFCTITILLTPQGSGNKTANLVINSDDPVFPVYNLTLTGTASTTASANISVNPSEITLSYIDIEMDDSRTIRISNTGTGSLIISSINVTGLNAVEFSINNNCTIIYPGSNCDFIVTGDYSSNTPKHAFIVISSNAQNAPKLEIPISASSSYCNGSTTLSSTSTTAPYEGANGTIMVTKTGEALCVWIAESRNSWISGSYSGNTVNYTISSNTTNTLRTGTLNVAGHPFTVIQHGSSNNTTFNDIAGNYFADYINAIYSRGITVGCVSNTSYCPQDSVTRGQMAAFIIRAMCGESFHYTTTPYFTDVPSDNGFFKYIQKLKDDNITVANNIYGIDSYVTRGQMAAFIIRALYGEDFSYTATPYFSDVPSNNDFFKYVQKMKDTGITAVSNIYDVDSVVTREQMAACDGRAFLGME